jgi:dephospho-CoA kinase
VIALAMSTPLGAVSGWSTRRRVGVGEGLAAQKVLGVTGGIGSGKTAASQVLAELGAVVIDADRGGPRDLSPGTPGWDQVGAAFGRGVSPDGTIDRKRLGAIVFADPAKLAQLNAIVHPLIRDAVASRIGSLRAAGQGDAVVVEAASWSRRAGMRWSTRSGSSPPGPTSSSTA